jgi:hypothetical protein
MGDLIFGAVVALRSNGLHSCFLFVMFMIGAQPRDDWIRAKQQKKTTAYCVEIISVVLILDFFCARVK